MKKRLQGLLAGLLAGVLISGTVAIAGGTTNLYDVFVGGVKVVVDGKEIRMRDANGNKVEPMIYNGTTYLPVRAIADSFDKEVYWDGPNYTVYLGDMDGELEYPTKYMKDMTNIGDDDYSTATGGYLEDNYGNYYDSARYQGSSYGGEYQWGEYLLNMKYSSFKGTLYVPSGTDYNGSVRMKIVADGRTVYTSPKMTKTSRPVEVDVDITGCNDFEVNFVYDGKMRIALADAGFYQ